MRTVPRRKKFIQAVAGMRHCSRCGHYYPPSSLVCGVCLPGGADLALAKAGQQSVEHVHLLPIHAVGPVFITPAPTYPDWVIRFSYMCPFDNAKLESILADATLSQLERDTALALYSHRRGEAIPANVDLVSVESGYYEALERRDEEIAPA